MWSEWANERIGEWANERMGGCGVWGGYEEFGLLLDWWCSIVWLQTSIYVSREKIVSEAGARELKNRISEIEDDEELEDYVLSCHPYFGVAGAGSGGYPQG